MDGIEGCFGEGMVKRMIGDLFVVGGAEGGLVNFHVGGGWFREN